jgi:hypothetical protein
VISRFSPRIGISIWAAACPCPFGSSAGARVAHIIGGILTPMGGPDEARLGLHRHPTLAAMALFAVIVFRTAQA